MSFRNKLMAGITALVMSANFSSCERDQKNYRYLTKDEVEAEVNQNPEKRKKEKEECEASLNNYRALGKKYGSVELIARLEDRKDWCEHSGDSIALYRLLSESAEEFCVSKRTELFKRFIHPESERYKDPLFSLYILGGGLNRVCHQDGRVQFTFEMGRLMEIYMDKRSKKIPQNSNIYK